MERLVALAALLQGALRCLQEAWLETLRSRAQVAQLQQQVALLQQNLREDRDALEESQAESSALQEDLWRVTFRCRLLEEENRQLLRLRLGP